MTGPKEPRVAERRPFCSQARGVPLHEPKIQIRWLGSRVVIRGRRGDVGSTYTLKLSQQTVVGGGNHLNEYVGGWVWPGMKQQNLLQLPAYYQERAFSYLSWRHESWGRSNIMRRVRWQCSSLLTATGIAPFPKLIAADSVFSTVVRCFLNLHRGTWD